MASEHVVLGRGADPRAGRRTPATTPCRATGIRPFSEVVLEPKPFLPNRPPLWFGGSSLSESLIRRIVRYGSGFNPLGRPAPADLDRLRAALADAGRDPASLEMVGGTRGELPSGTGVAELGEALASIPDQVEQGFTTICIKPSQFIDEPALIGPFCRDVVTRVAALVG